MGQRFDEFLGPEAMAVILGLLVFALRYLYAASTTLIVRGNQHLREYLADHASAERFGAVEMINALHKISSRDELLSEILRCVLQLKSKRPELDSSNNRATSC